LAACAHGLAPSSSGIEGRAMAGPTCPVERAGSPCPEQPVAHAVVSVRRDGREVSRFTTASDGTFTLALQPGEYELDPVGSRPPTGRPVTVVVRPGSYTRVDLQYDTGIR
jgi:hypothetical protein